MCLGRSDSYLRRTDTSHFLEEATFATDLF
jgi:hypothetical protein